MKSIFHHLQRTGGRNVTVLGEAYPGQIDTSWFYPKIEHTFQVPFPVHCVSEKDATIIDGRFAELIEGELETSEVIRPFQPMPPAAVQELLKVKLPAKRFGFELRDEGVYTAAILFEVLESAPVRGVSKVVVANENTGDVRLGNCDSLRLNFMWWDHGADKVNLDYYTFYLLLNPEKYGFSTLWDYEQALLPGARGAQLDHESLTDIEAIARKALMLLWARSRPTIQVREKVEKHTTGNSLLRGTQKPRLSPTHYYKIDPVELRRLETEAVRREITKTLADGSTKSIDGVVLVDGYDHFGGKRVLPYARCENEKLRLEATRLLQRVPCDLDALAAMIVEHGNHSTRARIAAGRTVFSSLFMAKLA